MLRAHRSTSAAWCLLQVVSVPISRLRMRASSYSRLPGSLTLRLSAT